MKFIINRKFIKVLLLVPVVLILIIFILGLLAYFKYGTTLISAKNSASLIKDEVGLLKQNLYKAQPEEVKTNLANIKENTISLNDSLERLEKRSDYIVTLRSILTSVDNILVKSEEDIQSVVVILTEEGPKINENYGKEPVEEEAKEEPQEPICGQDETDELLGDILSSTESEKSPEKEDSEYLRPFGVKQIIKALPTIAKIYSDNEQDILNIVKEINKIETDDLRRDIKLIEPYLKYTDYSYEDLEKYTHEFENLQELTTAFEENSSQVKTALNMLPDLLGANKPVTYLLVPQNEKELRSSGGLLTAWGLLTVDKGEIVGDISTVDMWDLENYTKYELRKTPGYKNIGGQLLLMQRGCGELALRAQDSGIYPDNYISMDMFKDYYDIAHENNPTKYKAYDHLITFNTYFPTDLVKVVEPLEIEDGKLLCAKDTAKTIFENTSVNYTSYKNRKSYIGEIAKALQIELYDLPTRDLLKVVQIVMNSVNAKHLSFYSKDEQMQSNFDALNLTARTIKDFEGDYFQFNEAQNCALKANFYVYDKVTQDINISDEGKIVKDVTVRWTNEQVVSGDKKEGNILSPLSAFRYRAWIRYYTPKGTTYSNKSMTGMDRIFINGVLTYLGNENLYKPKQFFDEGKMDKQVYDDIIWFDHRRFSLNDPAKTATHSIRITTPDNIRYDEETGYNLLIQKHPGKRAEEYTINITYKGQHSSTTFKLDRDKIVSFNKDGEIIVNDYQTNLDPLFDMIDKVRKL